MSGAGAIPLSDSQLALSALLILVNVGLSAILRLGLGRPLLIAASRMVVQLLLVGMVLDWLFQQENPMMVLLLALVMAAIAGQAAVARTRRRFAGIYINSLISVMASSALVTGLALAGILRPEPWYEPRYLIPLLGMVLGNTINGISLGLDRLMEALSSGQAMVEARICLGADRWSACRDIISDSVRVGMIPTINSMMVMGLVSLPGMMTGQILAGIAPAMAVRYQIMILFVIAAGTALGVGSVVLMGYFCLTTGEHQLRLDRLRS
jgi:putative ABC transport system permease protein